MQYFSFALHCNAKPCMAPARPWNAGRSEGERQNKQSAGHQDSAGAADNGGQGDRVIQTISVEQRLQAGDNVGRNGCGRTFFECAMTRPDIYCARVIARHNALGIRPASHQRDRKTRISDHGAALRYRTNKRQPAQIECLGRNDKNEPRAASFSPLGRVEIDVPNFAAVGCAHQIVSLPTGLADCHARSSCNAFFEKSHFARSSERVYRGLAIGVSVTLPRSTATLTRDPGCKFSRASDGLGMATTTEPPIARSVAFDMMRAPTNEVTYKYNLFCERRAAVTGSRRQKTWVIR